MDLQTYLNLSTTVARTPKYLDSITSRYKSFLLIQDEELKRSLVNGMWHVILRRKETHIEAA